LKKEGGFFFFFHRGALTAGLGEKKTSPLKKFRFSGLIMGGGGALGHRDKKRGAKEGQVFFAPGHKRGGGGTFWGLPQPCKDSKQLGRVRPESAGPLPAPNFSIFKLSIWENPLRRGWAEGRVFTETTLSLGLKKTNRGPAGGNGNNQG